MKLEPNIRLGELQIENLAKNTRRDREIAPCPVYGAQRGRGRRVERRDLWEPTSMDPAEGPPSVLYDRLP